MSELRWHPLLEEWVTVAPWRQERTYHPPADHCPLCPTRPGGPPTEIPDPDYYIAVFENRFPSYTADQGRCEVVCYTPDHDSSLGEQSVDHIEDLIGVWRDRTRELGRLANVRYVYIFENRGAEIGVTLSHPHGQIYAYPFIPPLLQRELAAEARHMRKTGRCLYCDVISGEDGERTVVRDDRWIAFVPAFARWPYEVHLAPLGHRGGLADLDPKDDRSFARTLKSVLQKYDRLFGRPLPYVMAMHQRPPGRALRHHHLHVEFYPPNRTADKLKFLAGSEIGAGAFILDARAEDTAAELRAL
ncbi:MAG TPA: galactose-1-phosphate uridylyltransferase [Candidatus Sulfotelmatobacter sp.]|nr:galactose-1-phosphate uridylyltransferase [Candidatus Sulfotelmatobacter sp.]